MGRRRALAPPPPDLIPPAAVKAIDLSDPPVREWKDAMSSFGSPVPEAPVPGRPAEPALPRVAFPKLQAEARLRHSTLATEECLVLLRRRDFDPMKFIHTIFRNEPIGQYDIASQKVGSAAEESKLSFLQAVAENIHNYVRAQDALFATRDQFASGQFPGQRDVKDLYEAVKAIRDKMTLFFSDISAQAKQAQNASALLSRISTYSFIFQLSSQIDQFRITGQFDEVARIVQKTKQFAFLEPIPLFASALKSIDIALRNVEDNLKVKLRATTLRNFNKLHCMLLMDIQREGNPVLELIGSIVQNVRHTFETGSLPLQCAAFEQAVPFWTVLCDFLREHSAQKFASASTEIDALFADLVRDVNAHNLRLLAALRGPPPGRETFNAELHASFRRSYAMWAMPMPNPGVAPAVRQIQANLQAWYIGHIRASCQEILALADPGVKLTTFLLQLLDTADLFPPAVYRDLVLGPIYGIYDTIHENAVVGDATDLIAAINTVSNLTTTNLDQLIVRCNTILKMKLIDPVNDDLIGVGVELRSMMMEKLLRGLTVTLNAAIYHAFFGSGTDWAAADIPIEADGYTAMILNKCIDCRCSWGPLYEELRPQIIQHVVASVLNTVSKIRSLSSAGFTRIDVNLQILKRAFGREPQDLWHAVDVALEARCTGRGAKTAEAIAKIAHAMRLQLLALE